ncbi:hypothetical protein [Desulfonatronum parangueonense]
MHPRNIWTICLLFMTLLAMGTWSCTLHDFPKRFSWSEHLEDSDKPDPEEADEFRVSTQQAIQNDGKNRVLDRFQQAMASYRKHHYSKAYERFVQVFLEADDLQVRDKALLGAALSDLLLAQANEDITHRLPDLERLFSITKGSQDSLCYGLLEPFLLKLVELRQQTLSYESLRIESRSQSEKITSLKEETSRLQQQVEELEALFQQLEQQKRQPLTSGATN